MRRKVRNKMRQSTKYFLSFISIALFFISLKSLFSMLSTNEGTYKKEVYSYTDNFSYSYNINLLDNSYMNEEDLAHTSKYYITGLIDYVDLNLNYSYEGSMDIPTSTSYKIIGSVQGVYNTDHAEQKVWQKEYVLKDAQTIKNTSKNFRIDEKLQLDLKKLNALVKQFQEEMNMSLDVKYVITMEVENTSIIEQNEEKTSYSPEISIDLGKKVTGIYGDNNKSDTSYITREYTKKSNLNIFVLIIDCILISVAIYIITKVLKSDTKVNIRNEYRQELNRLLRLCADKIVQISQVPSSAEQQVIDVKDFEEIIKVSEELFKPILYWDNKEQDSAWFIVMSNSIQYRYILKNKSAVRSLNEKKI